MVASLDPAMREKAVAFLRIYLKDSADGIRKQMATDPQNWWVTHHHGAMMGIRNVLRQNGFGEKEMGVGNLDDYGVGLVELAVATAGPFILTSDDSGHWYVIPANRQMEFCAWVESFEDDGDGTDQPAWAERVGGAPSLVEFQEYKIR
jgi:hypothetical protein